MTDTQEPHRVRGQATSSGRPSRGRFILHRVANNTEQDRLFSD